MAGSGCLDKRDHAKSRVASVVAPEVPFESHGKISDARVIGSIAARFPLIKGDVQIQFRAVGETQSKSSLAKTVVLHATVLAVLNDGRLRLQMARVHREWAVG